MLATLVGNGAAWSVATLPAIEAPANPPTNAILRVRMFSSVSCWEIPQARTAARAELGPLGANCDIAASFGDFSFSLDCVAKFFLHL